MVFGFSSRNMHSAHVQDLSSLLSTYEAKLIARVGEQITLISIILINMHEANIIGIT